MTTRDPSTEIAARRALVESFDAIDKARASAGKSLRTQVLDAMVAARDRPMLLAVEWRLLLDDAGLDAWHQLQVERAEVTSLTVLWNQGAGNVLLGLVRDAVLAAYPITLETP